MRTVPTCQSCACLVTALYLWHSKIQDFCALVNPQEIHVEQIVGQFIWQSLIIYHFMQTYISQLDIFFVWLNLKDVDVSLEGWERNRSKCFFTYKHLDLFRIHPSHCFCSKKWDMTASINKITTSNIFTMINFQFS